jgi:hypothetical protein
LDELEASRRSRRRAWENLQELRWILKDTARMDLPAPVRKTIDLEGRLVKDGVRKAIMDRKTALTDLVHAVRQCRKLAESKPLTLQGSDYADAVLELNKALDRADALLQ